MGYFGLMSGMGHGGDDLFNGQHDCKVYGPSATSNGTAKNAIVHLFSCCCGNTLSTRLINEGARAFIGYTDLVSVPQAVLCDLFISVATAIDGSIIAGDNSKLVKVKADIAYNETRANLVAHPNSTPRDIAEFEANHNALVGPWTNAKFGTF